MNLLPPKWYCSIAIFSRKNIENVNNCNKVAYTITKIVLARQLQQYLFKMGIKIFIIHLIGNVSQIRKPLKKKLIEECIERSHASRGVHREGIKRFPTSRGVHDVASFPLRSMTRSTPKKILMLAKGENYEFSLFLVDASVAKCAEFSISFTLVYKI